MSQLHLDIPRKVHLVFNVYKTVHISAAVKLEEMSKDDIRKFITRVFKPISIDSNIDVESVYIDGVGQVL